MELEDRSQETIGRTNNPYFTAPEMSFYTDIYTEKGVEEAIDLISRRASTLLSEDQSQFRQQGSSISLKKIWKSTTTLDRLMNYFHTDDLIHEKSSNHDQGIRNDSRWNDPRDPIDLNSSMPTGQSTQSAIISLMERMFEPDDLCKQPRPISKTNFHPTVKNLHAVHEVALSSDSYCRSFEYSHQPSAALAREAEAIRLLKTVSNLTFLLRAMRHRIAFMSWALSTFRRRTPPPSAAFPPPNEEPSFDPRSVPRGDVPDKDPAYRPSLTSHHTQSAPPAPTAASCQPLRQVPSRSDESALLGCGTGPFPVTRTMAPAASQSVSDPQLLTAPCSEGHRQLQRDDPVQPPPPPLDALECDLRGSGPAAVGRNPVKSSAAAAATAAGVADWSVADACEAAAAGLEAARERVRRFVEEEAARAVSESQPLRGRWAPDDSDL